MRLLSFNFIGNCRCHLRDETVLRTINPVYTYNLLNIVADRQRQNEMTKQRKRCLQPVDGLKTIMKKEQIVMMLQDLERRQPRRGYKSYAQS
jgi:hypothetical protein